MIKNLDDRTRVILFFIVVGISLSVAIGYATFSSDDGVSRSTKLDGTSTATFDLSTKKIFDVFTRSTKTNPRGALEGVWLSESGVQRVESNIRCERLHFAAGIGACLIRKNAVPLEPITAIIFNPQMQPINEFLVDGVVPSRVRVSPHGKYIAVTAFVQGHSYAASQFSTLTYLIETSTRKALPDLEQWETQKDGASFRAVDFNFWGVTFANDDDRFYATLGTAGRRYLVEGKISTRRLNVIFDRVECPSLSPDNKRIAFKRRNADKSAWRLMTLDLETKTETTLSETRDIDDQVEWLNNEEIVYEYLEQSRDPRQDVWAVRADETGSPRRLIEFAGSPAVVRDSKSLTATRASTNASISRE
jgi:hypothetical protein